MSLLSRLAVQAARAYGILSSNPNNVSVSYLVVAGGGGGGAAVGGGGGAGGYLTSTFTISTLNTYTIAVGAGGTGGAGAPSSGSNSVFSSITSIGGGGGSYPGTNPQTGGSGGGGSYANLTGASGTSGQGFAGGNGITGSGGVGSGVGYNAGGGGGASAVGVNATTSIAGAGGAGTASSITGSSVTYAGGGGGGGDYFRSTISGAGGTGGGGAGSPTSTSNGVAGTANTGGGGGGGGNTTAGAANNGAAGGSGIVIISYTSATPKFVGGTLTTSGGNQIHTFTSSGTLSPITPVTASYLVVAGGGGSSEIGGGGGAGGLLTSSTTLYSGATYVVTVGAGGAGNTGSTNGSSGSNSVLSGTGITTITSTGGGGGSYYGGNGQNGGSGGGSGRTGGTVGTGISGQGNNGGLGGGGATVTGGAGGGGGASAVGGAYTGTTSGSGGAGTASSISGTSITYAGGGGGGAYNGTPGSGGAGGGGNGASGLGNTGVSGTSNLGGGGGGGAASGGVGGSGGSGTVIISYAGSQVFNGGLVTSSGGNTIHTFNATGALTPLTNNLTNSLRFRRSASAYLNRTFSTPTNNKIWTYSAWVKRGALGTGTGQTLLGYGISGTLDSIGFNSSEQLYYFSVDSGGVTQRANYNTTAVFRDPSAWYHIVVAVDTTQATAANRFKLYVNGNQQAVTTTTSLALNWNTYINSALSQGIGWQFDGTTNYFDGYMDDINFIDGQALEPYYFGNNDANGVWKPVLYKGTYGTNGFYLTFADTTSTTTIGYDTSGNNNNWTTNNISLTAGTTYDAMLDVPTNTSATVANYAVLNPLSNLGTAQTLSEGNLKLTNTSSTWGSKFSTIGVSSGKWYAEFTVLSTSLNIVGIISDADTTITGTDKYLGSTANSYGYYHSNGNKFNNGTGSAYGATYTTNDVIGVALDMDNGTLTFYKNGTSQGTAYSSLSGVFYIGCSVSSASSSSFAANFGQRPFSYTPPTGFVRLNTFNLPTPTILQGNKYMDATLYTGTSTTNVIVNQGQFKPDFLWLKNRSSASSHQAINSVAAGYKLYPNLTDAQDLATDFTSFNSNGFTLTIAQNNSNLTGQNYVGWQWQAGQGSTSSNTSGTITSTVSVNATAGFSVVTWTGNGTAGATTGHGLGVAPSMVIIKNRTAAAQNWLVWHKSISQAIQTSSVITLNSYTGATLLNSTGGSISYSFDSQINGSTNGMVAYCWAEIAGFSKFTSYTGNGSADGPFIFLGFRPKFVMIKRTDGGTNNWVIFDSSRNTYNATGKELKANTSAAEYDGDSTNPNDFLSNGLKIRHDGTAMNIASGTYIVAAFAENPFKNANAR
jgi:hypothetical protein